MADLAHTVHGGPYGFDEHKVRVDFSVSLNAFGPAEVVRRAIADAPIDTYPDPLNVAPRQAAAISWNVPIEAVAFGAGASDLIYAMTSALLRPVDTVTIAEPTYGEYARAARMAGAHVQSVRGSSIALDVDALIECIRAHHPRLTFVCAPNNPTGEAIPRSTLEQIAETCASITGILVLDQSYDAFLEAPLGTPALRGHPAVIHLCSITKDHALAGIRAGFAIGSAEYIRAIELARIPWNASTVAQAAACAALTPDGNGHLAATIPLLRAERDRIVHAFEAAGIKTLHGGTHTLLARVGSGAKVRAMLLERCGIRVRDCASFGLSDYIRIAARTPAENEILLEAIPLIESEQRLHASGTWS